MCDTNNVYAANIVQQRNSNGTIIAMSYHHGNLKQQIILSAYESIVQSGLDGISLRNIAKIARVSPSAPYRHFTSKEHLLADVATLAFNNLYTAVTDIELTSNPNEDLVQSGLKYIEFGVENFNIMELMFHSPIQRDLFPCLLASSNQAFGALTSQIQRIEGASADTSGLNEMSILAYTHGLMHISQIIKKVAPTVETDFSKASLNVPLNLKKLLLHFVENLEFS